MSEIKLTKEDVELIILRYFGLEKKGYIVEELPEKITLGVPFYYLKQREDSLSK